MFAAFLTTFLWAASIVCAARSAKLLGGTEANFWRLALSTLLLAIWAKTFGHGLFGEAFPIFLLSGLVGVGAGDAALFQALPRLGSRLTLLLITCFTPPCGALIEWLWLGTTLAMAQIICGIVILAGVALALAPSKHLELKRSVLTAGVLFSALAALGSAYGAVLSRKAYAISHAAGQSVDGGTAAFQRLTGGLFIAAICLLVVRRREIQTHLAGEGLRTSAAVSKWKKVWPWVVANSVLGQALGVSCFQWALEQLPTGVVLSISAITPLVVIPFARVVEGERPTLHSFVGSVIAVVGVIGMALLS